MKYFSKLIIQTVMFSSALLFNSIAISNEYDFLCTGKQVITTPKNTIDNETTIQIIIRNNTEELKLSIRSLWKLNQKEKR